MQECAEQCPDAYILFDEIHTSGISYAQLDDFSGRIYSWLKSQGIGKEDFEIINLPRGIHPIIAMIGVWKAGGCNAVASELLLV